MLNNKDMNYNFKIDLAKILDAKVVDNEKGKFIVIPVEKNDIYLTDKGAAYMNFSAREMREEKFGQTHFIKQVVSKRVFKEMTEEERKNIPILGGMIPDNPNGGNNYQPRPQERTYTSNNNNSSTNVDNLPF